MQPNGMYSVTLTSVVTKDEARSETKFLVTHFSSCGILL